MPWVPKLYVCTHPLMYLHTLKGQKPLRSVSLSYGERLQDPSNANRRTVRVS